MSVLILFALAVMLALAGAPFAALTKSGRPRKRNVRRTVAERAEGIRAAARSLAWKALRGVPGLDSVVEGLKVLRRRAKVAGFFANQERVAARVATMRKRADAIERVGQDVAEGRIVEASNAKAAREAFAAVLTATGTAMLTGDGGDPAKVATKAFSEGFPPDLLAYLGTVATEADPYGEALNADPAEDEADDDEADDDEPDAD